MLQRLQNRVNVHFQPLFLLLLIGFLVVGSMTRKDHYLVITKYTPSGVVDWELNMTNARRDSILKEWQAGFKKTQTYTSNANNPKTVTGIEAVILHNNADYGFILDYTLLLLILIIRVGCQKAHPRKFVISQRAVLTMGVMTILAGLMDVFVNIATSRMLLHFRLKETLPDAWTIGIFAWTKYLLLIIITVKLLYEAFKLGKPRLWLEFTSVWLGSLRFYSWRFRIVLLVLLIFLLGIFSNQVQDLFLSINTSRVASIYFLLSTTLLALLCWHLPKAIDNARNISYRRFFMGPFDFAKARVSATKRPSEKVNTARLFGASGFLIPAIGIQQAMNSYHIDYKLSGIPPMIILIAVLAFYTIVLQYHWIDRFYKKGAHVIKWRYWLSMAVLLFPLVIWGWGYGRQSREPYFLAYLSLDLVFLSMIFLITATLRTSFQTISKWNAAPWITFSGLAALLFFILCNSPTFLNTITRDNRFFTMPVVLCALAGYLLCFSFLQFTGKKIGISLITFLLLFTIYRSASTVTVYHEAYIEKQKNYRKSLDSLDSYTENWLISRKQDINDFTTRHPGKTYPVFFVNAYGGGIRATVWTTMVIGTLDSLLKSENTSGSAGSDFQHYVFSYSGASGGTVGVSLLCSARYRYRQRTSDDTVFYPLNSLDIYRNDYFTTTMVGLLGRDMLASALGIAPWPDRARLMEQVWETHTAPHHADMRVTIGDIGKDKNYEVPLLFANTFDVDSGKKGIIAPVLLSNLDFPATIMLEQEIKDPGDLRLSTAAFLSARFPYISPSAKLDGRHHFMDGGTWDNSGAETSLQVLTVFERVRSRLIRKDPVFSHIQPQFLSLPNSVLTTESTGKPGNLFELLVPPKGILNSRVGYTKKADGWNYSFSRLKHYGFYQFRPTDERLPKSTLSPVLPLGWQMSEYAMTKLRFNVSRDSSSIDQVLDCFGMSRKKKK
ncbi:hypothetical protein [Mucilaginibacter sp. BT774]|uniref:hypothetical protein n=1 Tax=Mucilaginibacter sp. BT774 TaxID=3062276 RepID=UPI00267730F9|nr:hypothetical protein [Mucilaginibacter sp. BT774]MDO3628208.1 hypothetical protein [Mucilaginibacter sp. BT774]